MMLARRLRNIVCSDAPERRDGIIMGEIYNGNSGIDKRSMAGWLRIHRPRRGHVKPRLAFANWPSHGKLREGKCCVIPGESSSPSAVWKEANKIFSLINSRRPGLRVLGTAQGDEEA